MRIGIVTGEYPPMEGGVGAFSQILAQHLAALGHDLHVLTHPDATSTPGVTLSPTRGWGYAGLTAVRDWARAEQLDIVNLQYQTAAYGMSPWIHFLPNFARSTVPVVTTFHDLRFPYLFPKAGPLRPAIVRHLAKSSAGAIVTNAEDEQALSALPNVRLVPIGSNITATADPEASDRLRESVGGDTFLIGFFGFINVSKGLIVLLESLVRLKQDQIPVRLVVIGGRTGSSDATNREAAGRVDAFIAAASLENNVTFTGFVDDADVANWLAACDVVALPYRDGASYRRGTLMAAIHHGCAIVTTTPTVPIPAFVDGQNMRIIPPNAATALAGALRDLYADPALRERLRHGAAALRPLFDWSQIARDTVRFFETVL